ncbi:Arc family DNA-binding protein [Streptomyces sp. KR55]|uniref:Arc family DNA-binding protein n=1 Tax=Streptomyces sp. KR55 TaxID=3457425 RepID=UPI003FD4E7E8
MFKFTLRIPEELHARLAAQAVTDRRSLNAEILHLLEAALSAVPSGTQNRPGGDSASPAPLRGSGHSPRP